MRPRWSRNTSAFVFLAIVSFLSGLAGCSAKAPGNTETAVVDQLKRRTIGGSAWQNPVANTADSIRIGQEHFQHHCAVCHGLDGHNTGVPFASKMSPPVADLGERDVQDYSDGQLKWIVQNGLRFTGMPGWSGVLNDDEMWHIVTFMRHLPRRGSLGPPPIYSHSQHEHQAAEHRERGPEAKNE